MKRLNHSMGSDRRPDSSCRASSIRRILFAAAPLTALAAAFAGTVVAAQDAANAADPDAVAHRQWRETMGNTPTPDEGCFHASYPDLVWEQVECKTDPGRAHPVRATQTDQGDVVGNTNDYVAKANGLITQAIGGFAKVSGVTSETGVGVAGFKDKGILGPNEYSLQLNTNANKTTPACASRPGCKVWQQFVYSPDYVTKGEAAVYIQYWLLGWGTCPTGWNQSGKTDCFKNSSHAAPPDVKITDLGELSLTAIAEPGGNDQVMFGNGKDVWSRTAKDSVLDIGTVWNEAEFNVVGNAGGSRADFNTGASITVQMIVLDGSTAAPTCVPDAGTTGESNNLNLGKTCTANGGIPNIEFTESN